MPKTPKPTQSPYTTPRAEKLARATEMVKQLDEHETEVAAIAALFLRSGYELAIAEHKSA